MNKSPTQNNNFTSEAAIDPLSEETVRSVQELGEVLRQIHLRLRSEGYIIRNGQILSPESSNTNDGVKR
jgi:hypothetical protein